MFLNTPKDGDEGSGEHGTHSQVENAQRLIQTESNHRETMEANLDNYFKQMKPSRPKNLSTDTNKPTPSVLPPGNNEVSSESDGVYGQSDEDEEDSVVNISSRPASRISLDSTRDSNGIHVVEEDDDVVNVADSLHDLSMASSSASSRDSGVVNDHIPAASGKFDVDVLSDDNEEIVSSTPLDGRRRVSGGKFLGETQNQWLSSDKSSVRRKFAASSSFSGPDELPTPTTTSGKSSSRMTKKDPDRTPVSSRDKKAGGWGKVIREELVISPDSSQSLLSTSARTASRRHRSRVATPQNGVGETLVNDSPDVANSPNGVGADRDAEDIVYDSMSTEGDFSRSRQSLDASARGRGVGERGAGAAGDKGDASESDGEDESYVDDTEDDDEYTDEDTTDED